MSPGEECLTLALKGRCQNQLKRRQAGPERLMGNGHRLAGGPLRASVTTTGGGSRLVERPVGGLCEVHFLPLVVGAGDSNRTQRLKCVGRFLLSRLSRTPQKKVCSPSFVAGYQCPPCSGLHANHVAGVSTVLRLRR